MMRSHVIWLIASISQVTARHYFEQIPAIRSQTSENERLNNFLSVRSIDEDLVSLRPRSSSGGNGSRRQSDARASRTTPQQSNTGSASRQRSGGTASGAQSGNRPPGRPVGITPNPVDVLRQRLTDSGARPSNAAGQAKSTISEPSIRFPRYPSPDIGRSTRISTGVNQHSVNVPVSMMSQNPSQQPSAPGQQGQVPGLSLRASKIFNNALAVMEGGGLPRPPSPARSNSPGKLPTMNLKATTERSTSGRAQSPSEKSSPPKGRVSPPRSSSPKAQTPSSGSSPTNPSITTSTANSPKELNLLDKPTSSKVQHDASSSNALRDESASKQPKTSRQRRTKAGADLEFDTWFADTKAEVAGSKLKAAKALRKAKTSKTAPDLGTDVKEVNDARRAKSVGKISRLQAKKAFTAVKDSVNAKGISHTDTRNAVIGFGKAYDQSSLDTLEFGDRARSAASKLSSQKKWVGVPKLQKDSARALMRGEANNAYTRALIGEFDSVEQRKIAQSLPLGTNQRVEAHAKAEIATEIARMKAENFYQKDDQYRDVLDAFSGSSSEDEHKQISSFPKHLLS